MRQLSIILLFCLYFQANAQKNELPEFMTPEGGHPFENKSPHICSHPEHLKHFGDKIQAPAPVRKYNVLSYELSMDWHNLLAKTKIDSVVRKYTGKNIITILVNKVQENGIVLDAGSTLIIDSVKVNTVTVVPVRDLDMSVLEIPLPENTKDGDTVQIEIDYTYVGTQNYGFFVYPKGLFVGLGPAPDFDSVRVEENLAYTMSEPSDARFWMPCNDNPNDKAIASISVRVPNGYTVASNGLLDYVYYNKAANSSTYYWKDTTQIATYLMAATSSIYAEYSDWYKKNSNPNDSVEVKYYVWEKDLVDTTGKLGAYNAKKAFAPTVRMMQYFSEIFTEYPFVKYGMVALQPYHFGGMEHQTMTSILRSWLRGWSEGGIAHELAHQWLGDLVTCATWHDIWINEGGATWSEALWWKKAAGNFYYNNAMNGFKKSYLFEGGLDFPPQYDVTGYTMFSQYSPLVYQKAAWNYHMLLTMLGEETFFNALRYLFEKHAYSSITSDDFRRAFEEAVPNPPVPFETFFQQWVYEAGHPVYSLTTLVTRGSEKKYNVNVTVHQSQTGDKVAEVFTMPLSIMIWGPEGQFQRDTVINSLRTETYVLPCDFIPDSVMLDTTLVLCQFIENEINVNSVEEYVSNGSITIAPNPAAGGNPAYLTFSLDNNISLTAEVFDNTGRLVQNVFSGELPAGAYKLLISTDMLSTGVYSVRLRAGGAVSYYKLGVVK